VIEVISCRTCGFYIYISQYSADPVGAVAMHLPGAIKCWRAAHDVRMVKYGSIPDVVIEAAVIVARAQPPTYYPPGTGPKMRPAETPVGYGYGTLDPETWRKVEDMFSRERKR
jgi:hypothetical protein